MATEMMKQPQQYNFSKHCPPLYHPLWPGAQVPPRLKFKVSQSKVDDAYLYYLFKIYQNKNIDR